MKGQLSRLLLLLVFLSVSSSKSEPCYESTDADPYLYFSHKTAYQFVSNSKFKPVPYCRPKFVWMFVRHGTNYPNSNESLAIRRLHQFKDRVLKNHEERKDGHLCENVLESLKRWEFEINPTSEDDLSPQGKLDMDLLAKRTKDRMNEVFSKELNQQNFKIYSSEDRKVLNSAEEFTRAMFGDNFKMEVPIEIVHANSSLLGLESCPEWTNEMENTQASLFRKSDLYTKMVSQISTRLGFLDNITDSIVHAMYESCRYNKALVLDSYPAWCGLFNKEHLKLLEYYEDLLYYHKYGYGLERNAKVGCSIVRELIEYLNAWANNGTKVPSAVIRFGSSAGLLTTLMALDMVRDSIPLTYSNYQDQNRRQWKMSQVDPFAGNLAVVFYKCDQGDETNKVMFYLNEAVYDFSGCNVGLCSWKFIENKFKDYLGPNNCNKVCNDKSRASSMQNVLLLTMLLYFFTVLTYTCV